MPLLGPAIISRSDAETLVSTESDGRPLSEVVAIMPAEPNHIGKRFQRRRKVTPVPDFNQGTNRPLKPIPSIRGPEKSDDSPVIVVRLNAHWRVIECRDAIQWILQRRKGQWAGQPQWQGRSYCRTSIGLLTCIREHCKSIDEAALTILLSLPERMGEQR